MPFVPITDPADARLEEYRNVPDPDLIERRGVFVAEGRLVVARLLAGRRFVTRSVLVTEAARAALAAELDARPEIPVFIVPPWIINAITGFNIHRGCLAIGERPAAAAWKALLPADVASSPTTGSTIVVVERVANADNVGAVFRNAAAFGTDAVLLDPASTDPLYRKAIRTSMGAALQVPFARMAPWPGALDELRALGYRVVGMTPGAAKSLAQVIDDLPAEAGSHGRSHVASGFSLKIAILLGHEGDGLTAAALAACDVQARIPMAPEVDSLNVATSCAIALYELARRA